MRIGFCYDTKSDYGLQENNMDYTDFVSLHTVTEIKPSLVPLTCNNNSTYILYLEKMKEYNELIAKSANLLEGVI